MPNNPDGGPAFPSPSLACMEYRPMPGDEGMSLRDWFAGHALAGMLAHSRNNHGYRPLYGRHYAKHVRHALKFLKPGGTLTAILPATARYDHGELDDLHPRWDDLPVGATIRLAYDPDALVAMAD